VLAKNLFRNVRFPPVADIQCRVCIKCVPMASVLEREAKGEEEMKRRIRPIIVFAVCCAAAVPAMSAGSRPAGAQDRAGFEAFFDKVTKAEQELFRGRPESLKALWTRAADVTLFGVSGGSGEHGWAKVGPRLDWTNTQYRDGTLTVERIASYVDGNLGYVVQRETVHFKIPGRAQESTLQIRATWIFRRQRGGWRIVHRHADSLMNRQGPAEQKKK
jgi:ketosteroid isomerase-like protein